MLKKAFTKQETYRNIILTILVLLGIYLIRQPFIKDTNTPITTTESSMSRFQLTLPNSNHAIMLPCDLSTAKVNIEKQDVGSGVVGEFRGRKCMNKDNVASVNAGLMTYYQDDTVMDISNFSVDGSLNGGADAIINAIKAENADAAVYSDAGMYDCKLDNKQAARCRLIGVKYSSKKALIGVAAHVLPQSNSIHAMTIMADDSESNQVYFNNLFKKQ